MSSELTGIRGLSRLSKVSWTRRCLASALALASALGWSASAQAGVYNVSTNNLSGNGAMTIADDDVCSLAEAIESVNGNAQGDCVDAFPGSGAIIQFWEAPGRPFAQNHFRITSLTITRDVILLGSGAYIDSTGATGLVIDTNASVEIDGLTLTYTGTSGGRLIRNQGELAIFDSILQSGNVSGLSGTSGYGGAIYNTGTGVISYVDADVYLQSNRARRGGAIYNSTGTITDLRGVIQFNTATLAGGGIYNQSTSNDAFGLPKGSIVTNGATIMGNSAKAGGGVFNRGSFYLTGGYLAFNNASGTESGETTPAGQSLDGAGGGIVSTPGSSTLSAIFNTSANAVISVNTATGFGGGVYTAGQANLVGVGISDNRALSGAAVYAAPQGALFYCQIGNSGNPATINNNTLHATGTGRYSILDGMLLDSNDLRKCSISNTTAVGNSAPRYCRSSMIRTSTGSVCPQ